MNMDMPDMAGKPAENDYFAFSNNLMVITTIREIKGWWMSILHVCKASKEESESEKIL